MTPDENRRTARRLVVELFNAGNQELIDLLLAPGFVDHALPPGVPPTREGFRSMIPVLREAFPDLEYVIEDQIAEGDRVAQRLTARGSLQGEFMGMPPTGKSAEWQEMHIFRFDAGGLLAEHWDVTDSLGMMMQLSPSPSDK